MRFRLYEGRRTVPHTKAEMGIPIKKDIPAIEIEQPAQVQPEPNLEITPDTKIVAAFEWSTPQCSYNPDCRYRTEVNFDGDKFSIPAERGVFEGLRRNGSAIFTRPFNTHIDHHIDSDSIIDCDVIVELSNIHYPEVSNIIIQWVGHREDDYMDIKELSMYINGMVFEGDFGAQVYCELGLEEDYQLPDLVQFPYYTANQFNTILIGFLNRFLNKDAIEFIQSVLEDMEYEVPTIRG